MKRKLKFLGLIVIIALLASVMTGCFASAFGKDGANSDVLVGENNGSENSNTLPKNEDAVGYQISFVTNSLSTVEPITTAKLEAFPTEPLKNGYLFAGWFLDANLIDRVELPYSPTKAITFYAKWFAVGIVRITTYEQFLAIGKTLVGNYILDTDITLDEKFAPIGSTNVPFVGNFDGNGHKIKNLKLEPLTMNTSDYGQNAYGLFGAVKGNISNIIIENANITLKGDLYNFNIGLLCGQLVSGTITNVITSGSIINPKIIYDEGILDGFVGSYATPTRNSFFGGLVGSMDAGNIIKSRTSVTIMSETNADKVYIGGLVGNVISGTVSESSANAVIKGKIVGGLVGYNNGTISRSNATVDLKGDLLYPSVVGGITAYNYSNSSISISYAIGKAEGKTVGGLVGVNEQKLSTDKGAKISDCYANVAILGSEYAGGLVARVSGGQISNCIAYGKVDADNAIWKQDPNYPNDPSKQIKVYASHSPTFAGGLVAESWEGIFSNCIAFGNVTAISLNPSLVYNVAYSANGAGRSSSLLVGIFGVENQYVKRNNRDYNADGTEFNSSPILLITQLNSYAFLSGTLKFNDQYWNLVGINIDEKIYPILK